MMAVQHGHAVEPRAKPGHRLRREADLRHQHDRLPAEAHHFLDRLDVDFGLAAAGHAVNQNRAMLGRVQRFANRTERPLLIVVEFVRGFARIRRFLGPTDAQSARRSVSSPFLRSWLIGATVQPPARRAALRTAAADWPPTSQHFGLFLRQIQLAGTRRQHPARLQSSVTSRVPALCRTPAGTTASST